jgi:phosphoribosylformylglycinamidine synthase
VGGNLRDIFAIGARPIAVLDSLRFGEPHLKPPGPHGPDRPSADEAEGRIGVGGDEKIGEGARSRYLLDRAVAGIGHYGNSIGVPTIGGEVYFEGPYEQNCLVNAMALGIGRRDQLITSAAVGVGNTVVLFGASTGRDGIGGASVLASAELGEDDDKRPTVQVGDPFEEKKLMECSLELLERGLLVSLQDLGAAGLTSSASEMASKGEVGIDIDVSKVPLREADMEPFEIMVSESQERMLCVVEPPNVPAVLALCEKWEVGCAAIGVVTDTCRMRVFGGAALLGDMPVRALVDDCPLYDLHPMKPEGPTYAQPEAVLSLRGAPGGDDRGGEGAPSGEILLALLCSPNIASRRPLFEQYDAIVQSRTVRRPDQADAAVLTIRAHGATGVVAGPGGELGGASHEDLPLPAMGVSIDCNGRRVAADPYTGTIAAVLECASNLACVGAKPLGTTNNLNFANPEKPHIAWQLTEAVRGLGDACRALEAPIVGGNVSLYNESPPTPSTAGPIYPTPVIGMVGKLPDARLAGRLGFVREGDSIAVVGPFAPSLAASELAKLCGEALPDGLPPIDLAAVIAAQDAIRAAVRAGELSSAHDIAEGGLAVALAECSLAGGIGAQIELDDFTLNALFGEGSGGFVVSGGHQQLRALGKLTPVQILGRVGGEVLRIAYSTGERENESIELTLAEMNRAHGSLAELFA